MSGTLYVVATPIGNLEDITLRALSVLRAVAVVACEDTRRTRVLLDRHGIAGRLVAFHKFNERRAAGALVGRLLAGEDVALVSDGGTPAVADPGYRLVRDALDAGIAVTPLPGPSAFVAAVSASGLPSERVTFHGFFPHRSGERRRLVEAIRDDRGTQVFYESPRRIAACLADLAELLGDRRSAVVREMTKRFETWHRGRLGEVAAAVGAGPAKGEFCVVIEGAPTRRARSPERSPRRPADAPGPARNALRDFATLEREDSSIEPGEKTGIPGDAVDRDATDALGERLRRAYESALAAGADRKEALRRAASVCGLSRREAYRVLNAD